MRNLLYTFIFCLTANVSFAAILTVSNSAANPGQYSTIDAAINAASSGDTIYIHGSGNMYSGGTVTKQLYFLGTGHHPRKQNPLVSYIQQLHVQSTGAGSTFDGLLIHLINGELNNVTIKNSEILGAIHFNSGNYPVYSNSLIENNIMHGGVGYTYSISFGNNPNITNTIIRNNIIHNNIEGINSSITIDHNLFYSSTVANAFTSGNNAIITNNIFYMMSPQTMTNSTFLNNITYNTSADVIPYGSNMGSGNLIGMNPMLLNFPPAGAAFNPSHNYHPAPNSPAHNAGTDGTHIGPEGGLNGFSMTGEPHAPVIRHFNILNTTVPSQGQLNINVRATKAEDQ